MVLGTLPICPWPLELTEYNFSTSINFLFPVYIYICLHIIGIINFTSSYSTHHRQQVSHDPELWTVSADLKGTRLQNKLCIFLFFFLCVDTMHVHVPIKSKKKI